MKRTMIFIAFSCLMAFIGNSCSKDQNSTQMAIKVINPSGDPVSSASVTLFKSSADLSSNSNIQDIQYTDSKGVAIFDNLSATVYYYNVYRNSDCASNAFTTSKTSSLTGGQLNNETVTVNQVGQVSFKNTSGDQYDVSINGTFWKTLNPGSSVGTVVKTGNYAIHVKQASGFTTTPIEKDYTADVSSCSTQEIDFP